MCLIQKQKEIGAYMCVSINKESYIGMRPNNYTLPSLLTFNQNEVRYYDMQT